MSRLFAPPCAWKDSLTGRALSLMVDAALAAASRPPSDSVLNPQRRFHQLKEQMSLRKILALMLSHSLLAACLALLTIPAAAQQIQTDPQVTYEIKHDVSLPLGYLAQIAPKPKRGFVEMIEPQRNLGLTVGIPGEDTVVQGVYLPTVHTTQLLNIEGTREDQGNAQVPDTNGSVGATQFVEITNFDYEVFDKATGKVILKPTNTNTIFTGFGGACDGTNPGDPVVVWDKLAQRWLVTYFNYTTDLTLCIAVSTTSDATGIYNRYSYGFRQHASGLSEVRGLAGCVLCLGERLRKWGR
jgi:hypothetical protein